MSTIKTDTLSNVAGDKSIAVDRVAQGVAAAWVNFDGTGTVAIRAAYNVSSITDNGTGNYTVNFTTAMPDANYSTVATASTSSCGYGTSSTIYSETQVRITTALSGGSSADSQYTSVAIFR